MASKDIPEKTHEEERPSGKEERTGKRPSKHQEATSGAEEVVPDQAASLGYWASQGDAETKGK